MFLIKNGLKNNEKTLKIKKRTILMKNKCFATLAKLET